MMKTNRATKKPSYPNMKKIWFSYVTLPLFFFMLTSRIVECVIHNLFEQDPDGNCETKSCIRQTVPLKKTAVKVPTVSMEPVGKAARTSKGDKEKPYFYHRN